MISHVTEMFVDTVTLASLLIQVANFMTQYSALSMVTKGFVSAPSQKDM